MILTKDKGMRMWGGFGKGSGGSGGSGGGGGGGGSASYAEEAGHALTADEATHATNADHATSADTATNAGHATTADSATHATSADTATNANHALTSDEATHATSAADLDQNSTVWSKVMRKDVADTAAEIITFAKGLVSTLVSKFKAGIKIGANDDYGIDANGDATLRDISGRNTTTESLTVTKEAHFFKLVVDEMMSNKGAIIVSNANCIAEKVVVDGMTYKVYFAKTDKDGRTVDNSWKIGDQALCLTFKGEGTGTFENVTNRYYWRRVTGITSDDADYHMIRLSNVAGNYEGSTVPAAGDDIVQLGYAGSESDNDYRKSAVILSAYPTMDTGLTPPSLAFYRGINDFALATHRYTFMDGLSNEFMGNFKVLVNGSYQNLTTVLATIDGLVTTVTKSVRGKNLIPSEGWSYDEGDLLPVERFDPGEQCLDNGNDDVLYSPVVYLPAGTYVFSLYSSTASLELYIYSSAQNKPAAASMSVAQNLFIENVLSGDTYQSLARRYVSFTLQDDAYVVLNVYEDSTQFTAYRPQLEYGNTPTAWEIGTVIKSSQVKQTADLIRLQVGQCGLDLTNEAITAKGGKFKMQDNAGNDTFVLDQNGNLVSQGDASFGGTIKAQNFYHGVVMHGEEDCWLCLSQDSGSPYSFTVGKYYTQAEVEAISNNQYGSPPTYIDTSRGFYEAFANCTGSADIVVIMAGTSGTGDLTIVLPCAADYDGKIVEIVDTRYVQSGYMGSLCASQADGGWKMKGNFNESAPSDTVTLNGNYDTEGRSRRLLSYKQDYNGVMTSFWIVLKTS